MMLLAILQQENIVIGNKRDMRKINNTDLHYFMAILLLLIRVLAAAMLLTYEILEVKNCALFITSTHINTHTNTHIPVIKECCH